MRIVHVSAIFLFLSTSAVWGLGLGDIEVRSAFTKKFEAVIPVALQNDDGALDVEIGKETDYRLMQLARPEFIDWLLLRVEPDPEKPGGKLIVVSSPKPIYRPSFNLVIRASAGGGTVMENYLLAVDFRKSLVLDLPELREEEESVGVATKEAVVTPRLVPVVVAPVVAPPLPPVVVAPVIPPPVVVSAGTYLPKLAPAVTAPVVTPSVAPIDVPEEPKEELKEEPAASAKVTKVEEPILVVVKRAEKVVKPESVKKPHKPLSGLKRIIPLPVPEKVEEIPPAVKVAQVVPVAREIQDGHEFLKLNPDIFKNRRVVQSGDTLYGIARKLGASKKDRSAVAVAIYLENERAFINGNINRLKSGAKLVYSRVNELAADVTSFDARAFIERQFVQWKSRKRAPISIENPATERISFGSVLLFLENWKSHWMKNNMKALAGDYADSFRDRRGRNKAAFLKARKKFNDRHPNIKLLFENISATRMGQTVSVTFTQSFSSDNYSSMGRKQLALKPSRGELAITREEFSLKKGFSGKHAWVVHLASYRGKATVKAHIGRLQSAGFSAFEASALHPDGNKWYRLMVGRATDRQQARRLASELNNAGEPYTAVLELPFALEAAVKSDYDESLELVNTLGEKSFSPYMVETVETSGKTHYAVYVGAFATEETAGVIRETLMQEGIKTRVTAP